MEWVICFAVNWTLVALLGGWKREQLKTNIWCGLFAVAIQLLIDTARINMGYYKIERPVIPLWGSSLFFIIGPVFGEGVLFSMLQPKKVWAKTVHVLFYTLVFSLAEHLTLKTGALVYLNWKPVNSLIINFMSMTSLGWFSIVILKRG